MGSNVWCSASRVPRTDAGVEFTPGIRASTLPLGQFDKILQQPQPHALTLLRVELRGEDVVAPDGRGECAAEWESPPGESTFAATGGGSSGQAHNTS